MPLGPFSNRPSYHPVGASSNTSNVDLPEHQQNQNQATLQRSSKMQSPVELRGPERDGGRKRSTERTEF